MENITKWKILKFSEYVNVSNWIVYWCMFVRSVLTDSEIRKILEYGSLDCFIWYMFVRLVNTKWKHCNMWMWDIGYISVRSISTYSEIWKILEYVNMGHWIALLDVCTVYVHSVLTENPNKILEIMNDNHK